MGVSTVQVKVMSRDTDQKAATSAGIYRHWQKEMLSDGRITRMVCVVADQRWVNPVTAPATSASPR